MCSELRDKEWDDRPFNFCNDTMRLKFMYAKYFLSSKNRENKHFISLSFYIAQVGGRVAQVKLCLPENCRHSNSRA